MLKATWYSCLTESNATRTIFHCIKCNLEHIVDGIEPVADPAIGRGWGGECPSTPLYRKFGAHGRKLVNVHKFTKFLNLAAL